MSIYRVPTFILRPLRKYKSIKSTNNVGGQFDFLQDTAEVLTKYLAVASLSILSKYDIDLFKELSRKIFISSSVGPWINAIEESSKALKDIKQTSKYGSFYLEYDKHDKKQKLKEIDVLLSEVLDVFKSIGIKTNLSKSYSIIDFLKKFLFIRNKDAHIRPSDIKLAKLIDPFYKAIQDLLMLIDFDYFVFNARYISHYCELVDENPIGRDYTGEDKLFFWASSPFLNDKMQNFQLVHFCHDSQEVYFLNDQVNKKQEADYICYYDKTVIHAKLNIDWLIEEKEVNRDVKINLDEYIKNKKLLNAEGFEWVGVDFTTQQYELLPRKGAIYYFYIELNIFNVHFEHLLYIGRTEDLKERFRTYLLNAKNYDDSRKEILKMFHQYNDNVKFKFCYVSSSARREDLEELIYRVFDPEINLIKPSKTDRGQRGG
jgi:hypothetical protein